MLLALMLALTLAGAAAESAGVLAEEATALAADGECSVVEGPGCALSALQSKRALQQAVVQRGSSLWCAGSPVPKLWAPTPGSGPTSIRALSYNLYWWYLFRLHKGNGDSAGRLIGANMEPPFDVMGFQECEDPRWLLEPVGLMDQYQILMGKHAVCMAYNKKAWAMISNGTGEVAEDMKTKYYGKRGSQWMRLQHLETELTLFFINHHGPLSVNSGGICGGEATSHNILQMIAKHGKVGDTVVLVGDFNANAGSKTIQDLWRHLVLVMSGKSWGGVDNIFSNAEAGAVVEAKILGSGGSDHDAIAATIRVESGKQTNTHLKKPLTAPFKAAKDMTGRAKPGYHWANFWCGQMEADTEYVMSVDAFIQSLWHLMHDPERCCRECQVNPNCTSWAWKDYSSATKGRECILSGAGPVSKRPVAGVVSGLPYIAAAHEAQQAAYSAISQL
jgi:hypothetical protein